MNSGGLSALSFSGRDSDPFDWTVQFGELTSKPSFWNLQAYSNRYQVEGIFLSPKYTHLYSNDIALLKLSSPVNYNNHIQPICLLNSTFKFENRNDCWVTGWGTIGEDESESGYRRGRGRGASPFFHTSPPPPPDSAAAVSPSPPPRNIFSPIFLTSACQEDRRLPFPSRQGAGWSSEVPGGLQGRGGGIP